MFNKLQITTAYGILLVVTLLIAGCALYENLTGCCDVDDITWCNKKREGRVKCMSDSMVLHDSKEKTEMKGNIISDNLDCVFELEFDRGGSDSSVGLEIWDPLEHSITFRGGAIKVVTAGEVVTTTEVGSYVGKRIEVHLKASDKRLFAAIDGDIIVDGQHNWSERHKLEPRLNADRDDTVTLYSSSCSTK